MGPPSEFLGSVFLGSFINSRQIYANTLLLTQNCCFIINSQS